MDSTPGSSHTAVMTGMLPAVRMRPVHARHCYYADGTDGQTPDRYIALSARRAAIVKSWNSRKRQARSHAAVWTRTNNKSIAEKSDTLELLELNFFYPRSSIEHNNTTRQQRVAPQRDVTVLARRAVSAARPTTRLAAGPPTRRQRYRRRRQTTPTDASEQNNTGRLGP